MSSATASRIVGKGPAGGLLLAILLGFLPQTRSVHAQTSIVDVGSFGTTPSAQDTLRYQFAWSLEIVNGSEIAYLPLITNSDILSAQTMVYAHTGFEDDVALNYDRGFEQYHIRGGRSGAIAFTIDGLQVTDPLSGAPVLMPAPASVAEMTILAGGFSARYGNALSGVIDFVTRSGGLDWSGSLNVLSSEFSGNSRDDVRDMTVADGHIGVPIPVIPGVTMFLSGSARTSRDYLVEKDKITYDLEVDPSDPDSYRNDLQYDTENPYLQRGPDGRSVNPLDTWSGWLGYGFNTRWDALANISWRLANGSRLRTLWSRSHQLRAPYTHPWRYSMFWGLPGEIEQNAVLGTPRYDAAGAADIIPGTGAIDWPNEKNIINHDTRRYSLIWTGQYTPKIHYSVRAAYFDVDRTMRVHRWVNEEGLTVGNQNRSLVWDAEGNPVWGPADPMTLVVLERIPFVASDENGRRYGYAPIRNLGSFKDGSDRFHADEHTITRTVKGDVTAHLLRNHRFLAGFSMRSLSIDENEVQLPAITPPYIQRYRRTAGEFSLYLQDTIETPDMILDLGLRYDSMNSGRVPFWLDPRMPIDQNGDLVIDPYNPETAPIKTSRPRRTISPRFGIAHPLSERSVVFANYGLYCQNPLYRHLYLQGTLEDANPLIGNPSLVMERSRLYEFGFRHFLSDLVHLRMTLWVREMSGLVGTEHVPAFFQGLSNPYDYTVFLNYDHGLARGIDLAIERRFRGIWSGSFRYSFMQSEVNRDEPLEGYHDGESLITMPKRLHPLTWEQPHRFATTLNFRLPQGWGPALLDIHPLERITLSVIYRLEAGRPYTPTTRDAEMERNSGRMPWTSRLDLRLYRDLTLMKITCSLYANIRNLFDRRNALAVWSRTGSPDDPGPGSTGFSDDYDRSHYFTTPRMIDFGIRVHF